MTRRAARFVLPATLGLVLSCASPPEPGRTFLLLTIDTLRADRLGHYGCPDGTSPALDGMAARSVVLLDCVSVSSWTMPAMGTLGTGLRPNEHGMVYWHLPLADVPETMAEVLQAENVATAFLGNPIPRLEGLDRGFDVWRTFEGDDDAATAAAIEWLGTTEGRDRFLWVHLLAPHAPYDPLPGAVRPAPGFDPRAALYDGEIRTADRNASRIVRELGEDAAILVTSDHGETLDEREELAFDHGKVLYEELLRIPCLASFPGVEPHLEPGGVVLADIPATICDWFDIEAPAGSGGASLLPALAGNSSPEQRVRFAFVVEDEPPRHRDRRWSVRGERMKTVFNVDRDTVQLFDLGADPGERTNLADSFPDQVAAHRAELAEWLEAAPTPRIPFEKRFTNAELERLQSLGYLGGARD